MGSFIIPAGFGGLIAPQTIYFDNGIQIEFNRVTSNMMFGDGYKSLITRSPPKRMATVSLTGRDLTEIELVDSYLTFLGGGILPSLSILDQEWNGIVTSWNKTWTNGEVSSLSAKIEEL